MRTNILALFLSGVVGGFLDEQDLPPVPYEFVAVAVAYFDAQGRQVGRDMANNMGISTVPERMPNVGEVVPTSDGGFRVVSELGKGTDSVVYLGEDITNPKFRVAIKFQMYAQWGSGHSVESEFQVLSALRRFGNTFPNVFFLSSLGAISRDGEVSNLRYLIMELLGSSIWSLTKLHDLALPMRTIASVGVQCIEGLEKMHSAGFIHGDIHLENILFEHGPSLADGGVFTHRVLLGDYGKSESYLDTLSGMHRADRTIEYSTERNLLYLSPFELAMGSPSRREDIYRLMETLARMMGERVYSEKFKHLQHNREALMLAKQSVPITEIFPAVDPIFVEMFEYARALSYDERPDYSEMKAKFIAILKNCGHSYDGKILLP